MRVIILTTHTSECFQWPVTLTTDGEEKQMLSLGTVIKY